MKILYSCLSRSWGGMEMYSVQLIDQLLKKKYSCELICYPGSRIESESRKLGIKIYTVAASGYFSPVQIFKTSRIIKEGSYGIVHSQASRDLWTIVPALKLASSRIPLFLSKHLGSFIVKKDLLHQFIYARVNCALAISKVIEKNLVDTCPLTPDKVRLLHNGIDTTKFDPDKFDSKKVRNEFYIGDDSIVIGMLARFSPGKGHEEFLTAAFELSTKFDNLVFMIVGGQSAGESEYFEDIKKLAASFKITNKIIFTGFRSDIAEVLAAMDVFAFPSHAEAFGLALIEAMSMGKPSVCSDSDGVLDIAIDGVTSFLFKKQDAADLKIKLEQLILSPVKRNEFGKAARTRAVEFFDNEVMLKKLIDFYNDAISGLAVDVNK